MVADIRPNDDGAGRDRCGRRPSSESPRSESARLRWTLASGQGAASQESAEIRWLRAQVKKLRRANEILKAASAFFAAEVARADLVASVDEHKACSGSSRSARCCRSMGGASRRAGITLLVLPGIR